MSVLQKVLAIIAEAAAVASVIPNPEVQAGTAIAEGLLAIVQKSIAAYEAHAGQPIDLSQLKKIDPIA